ncbi:MAG: hypothetical protein RIR70_2122 [Pseudomonadota bacterium]|jgi:VanZ family protein
MSPTARHDSARLARYGALVYALVIIYASLNPFTGWRDNGVPLFDFFFAAWPRYWTAFDLFTNLAAYVPLGFLLFPALYSRLPRWLSVLLALLLPAALSAGLETLQNFLPARVPSNVDFGCNVLGGLLGVALGLRFGGLFADGGAVFRLRRDHMVSGRVGDAGLILMLLWLMTQMNPALLLFGHGDLRSLLGLAPALPYSAEGQVAVEWGIAVLGPLAAGLVAREVMRELHWPAIIGLLLAALAVRGVSAGVILGGEHVLQWATPGNKVGFVIGAGLLCMALGLPSWARRALAALCLLVGTALANLAPENPYLLAPDSPALVDQFFNFNGLTRLASVVWPFAALMWLMTPSSGTRARA